MSYHYDDDPDHQAYPPPQRFEPVERTGVAGCLRIFWGIGFFLAIGWMCYGIARAASFTDQQMRTAAVFSEESRQATDMLAAGFAGGLGVVFFLCTGLPILFITGLFYWRNGVAIRETKKHNQMIRAMTQRRR